MPEALTYTSLKSDIQLYANRSDTEFVAQIPRFIMLAENRLASEIKGLGMLMVANFTVTNGTSVYEKPARWRQTHSISISNSGNRQYLKPRSLQYVQTYWPDSSLEETPLFYADYDYEYWLILPTADQDYSATASYYERPQPLDETNETNWTTRYAPQLLLYASLLEAQPFLKTPERIQEFQMMYDRSAAAISQENVSRFSDQSSIRSPK